MRTSTLVVLAMLVAAWAVAVAINLSLPINHDEYQYISAAHLVSQLEMYKEFMYSQTPYYPYVLNAAQAALAPFGISPHVAARLVNALASCVFLSVLVAITWRLSGRSVLLVAAVLAAILASGYFALSMQTARNDMIPLALYTTALLIVHSALSAEAPRRRMLLHFSAAFLIGLAVCAKQSYAFLALGYFLWAVFISGPTWTGRLREVALPAAFGGALAAVPAAMIILPNLEIFLFDVFTYHRTAHIFWAVRDEPDAIAIASSAFYWPLQLYALAKGLWEPLAALNTLAVLALAVAFGPRQLRDLLLSTDTRGKFLALILVSTAFLLVSFVMARPFHGIYAPPLIALMAISAALLSGMLRERGTSDGRQLWHDRALAGFALFSSVFGAEFLPPLSKGTQTTPLVSARLLAFQMPWEHPDDRSHFQVHGDRVWLAPALDRTRRDIRSAISPTALGDEPLRIAGIYSSTVIDAGFDIYPQFASTPFFFWGSMAIFDDETIEKAVGVRETDTVEWLEENDVQVVLTSDEPGYENGFADYAEARGFTCFEIDTLHLFRVDSSKLYVAPELASGAGNCAEDNGAGGPVVAFAAPPR